jgi:polysaccharide biosynthesis/export protein
MKSGEGWSVSWLGSVTSLPPCRGGVGWAARICLGLALGLAIGCASGPAHLDQSLLADKGTEVRNHGVTAVYRIHCPDVLEIAVDSRPDLSGLREVAADGRIDLGSLGKLRVEGNSIPEVISLLANATGLASHHVHVKITEFKSQQVYLYGQVIGWQRAVPYQGPETILDLLHRVGGITPGAAPNRVYVVRTRPAEEKPPEVFPINLNAIVKQNNQQTNLRLEPFDQVYVGEARKATVERFIPPVLRPVYEIACGMRRPNPRSLKGLPAGANQETAIVRKPSPPAPAIIRGASPRQGGEPPTANGQSPIGN